MRVGGRVLDVHRGAREGVVARVNAGVEYFARRVAVDVAGVERTLKAMRAEVAGVVALIENVVGSDAAAHGVAAAVGVVDALGVLEAEYVRACAAKQWVARVALPARVAGDDEVANQSLAALWAASHGPALVDAVASAAVLSLADRDV